MIAKNPLCRGGCGLTTARVIAITLLLAVMVITIPITAQDMIGITENSLSVDFPESVMFNLSAQSPADIDQAILTYGTNQRTCHQGGSRQVIRFEPGSPVELEWEWDLMKSGGIPPGAQIWWEWFIHDSDGNSLTTERREFIVSDDRYNWSKLTQDGVSVNWYRGDDTFGREVLGQIQEILDDLEAEIGRRPGSDIVVWIYPSAADVRDALAISSEWTGAVAFPEYNILFLSLQPGQDSWAASVIPHELAHLVVRDLVFNCKGGYMPVWLSEGLSVYAEGPIASDEQRNLLRALESQSLPPLHSLGDGFSAYGAGANLAYAHSGEVVRYLIQQHGADSMKLLLDAIAQGHYYDRALEEVYDFDTNELDARWRREAGYNPTPTVVGDDNSIDLTPTLIPTMGLFAPPVVKTPEPETATPTLETTTAVEGTTNTEPAPATSSATVEKAPTKAVAAVVTGNAIPADSGLSAPIESPEPAPASNGGGALTYLLAGLGATVLIVVVVVYRWRRSRLV